MFVSGAAASEFFLMRFSFVVLVLGFTWTFWGLQLVKAFRFPLLLLAVSVPLPTLVYSALFTPLQEVTTTISLRLAQAMGISILKAGNVIQLAAFSLPIPEALSTLGCLAALPAAAMSVCYLLRTPTFTALVIAVSAGLLVPSITVLRIVGTALLADRSQTLATVFYRAFSGWSVLVIGATILYLLARIWQTVLPQKQAGQ